MEKVAWKVEGMTCSNCALSISKYLSKKGMEDIKVNPLNGEVFFNKNGNTSISELKEGITGLGYHVHDDNNPPVKRPLLSSNKSRFLFCLPFTAVLMLHMLHPWLPLHWLMNPWIQLALCLPVFITGMYYFGKSAWKSIRNGMPNMDVLITIGALASFVYSLVGLLNNLGEQYLFFETTASIITLVFMGNYLEDASVRSTQKALRSMTKTQKVMANMIAFDDAHREQIFPVENSKLHTGDLILIKTGEIVPADCKILSGDCLVDESIITGESTPVSRQKKDKLIGGSMIQHGIVKAQVAATGKDTVLSGIVRMVQNAQSEKPPMQKMADRISAIFVPVVIGISILTFVINYFAIDLSTQESLMRSIAVLVISCPCAMGLATPAAIAVGLGRGAKNGILYRNASVLESFKSIRQVVFDKTGTLTTGKFSISRFETILNENDFRNLVYSLEKYSNHPIAASISDSWKTTESVPWKTIEEIKGRGIIAEDHEGNIYKAGSAEFVSEKSGTHSIYVIKNNEPIGWIDVRDEIRPEAAAVISWLHSKNIKSILLSGDRLEKCQEVAGILGIDEVYAEQTPEQKLEKISALNNLLPTAMIGDGINDAPALAKATIGISMSEASQIALQSSDVILMNKGLKQLPQALGLGKHTYLTIKQNLFWAFAYNIIAIPVAAIGLLTPTVAALAMGFSDVVLGVNSVRLFVKKVL